MFIMFNPQSVLFKPKSDFHKQILAHVDDVPLECDEVPSGVKKTDYDSLSKDQIRYYIWWRDCLRKGKMISEDVGYCYLRVVEMAHGTDPVDSALDQIELIRESDLLPIRTLNDLRTDLCIVNGLDLPESITWGDVEGAYTSAALAYPPREMDVDDILSISGYPDLYFNDHEKTVELFNDSLHEIDRYLLETTGSDISATYGKRKTKKHTLFVSFYPEKEVNYYVEYDEFDDRLRELMKALLTYCSKKFDPEETARVSSVLTKDMRRIVDTALVKGHVRREPVRREWKGYRFIPESEYVSPVPVIRPLEKGKYTYSEPKKLHDSIISYRDTVSDGPSPYVECYSSKPSHVGMSAEQRGFYLHFRQCALEGKFIDTDEGYLWLLLADLINNKYDNSLETIIGIRDAYFPGNSASLPGATAVEYAALMEEDLPDDSLYSCYLGYVLVMTQILEGREGHMSADGLMGVAGITHKGLRKDMDDDCTEIANLAIRRINEEVSKKSSNGIMSKCRLRRKTEKIQLFSSVKYYPENPRAYTVPITVIDYAQNSQFHDGMNSVLRTVVQATKAIRQNKKPSFTDSYAFGLDIEDIVMDVADSYLKGKKAPVKTVKRDVTIDRDAVGKAQDDLKDVTEMMAVGDGEHGETVEEETTVKTSGDDPWGSLLSSLTDEERTYLETLSKGERPKGKRPVRRIDSINAKAMDTVGDTLIDEDGLIEDYADDVRRMFGDSDPYSELMDSLTDDEREYVVALVSGPKPKGRRPVKRIESINSKAVDILGSELIEDGSIPDRHTEGISRTV